MTTRRSGLRLFIPRLPPPGGGGDFVGMTLPKPFPPPAVPSRLGEAREFTNPFPEKQTYLRTHIPREQEPQQIVVCAQIM